MGPHCSLLVTVTHSQMWALALMHVRFVCKYFVFQSFPSGKQVRTHTHTHTHTCILILLSCVYTFNQQLLKYELRLHSAGVLSSFFFVTWRWECMWTVGSKNKRFSKMSSVPWRYELHPRPSVLAGPCLCLWSRTPCSSSRVPCWLCFLTSVKLRSLFSLQMKV